MEINKSELNFNLALTQKRTLIPTMTLELQLNHELSLTITISLNRSLTLTSVASNTCTLSETHPHVHAHIHTHTHLCKSGAVPVVLPQTHTSFHEFWIRSNFVWPFSDAATNA